MSAKYLYFTKCSYICITCWVSIETIVDLVAPPCDVLASKGCLRRQWQLTSTEIHRLRQKRRWTQVGALVSSQKSIALVLANLSTRLGRNRISVDPCGATAFQSFYTPEKRQLYRHRLPVGLPLVCFSKASSADNPSLSMNLHTQVDRLNH